MTIYKKQCVDWGNTLRGKAEEFYAPVLRPPMGYSQKLRLKGTIPKKRP
ncbi:hypothetical protein [Bradyrhizobium japonicum]|nr:hypothetical protein [Bradyrhizobium japonicum]BAL06177.1 hypothetical protein BJ6T_08840 [Bradyrhizobium japonicum USDA 6]